MFENLNITGYGNYRPSTSTIPSENLILLYSKEKKPERVFTEPISHKDFLFPSKKKTKAQIIDVVSEDRMSKYKYVYYHRNNNPEAKVDAIPLPFLDFRHYFVITTTLQI